MFSGLWEIAALGLEQSRAFSAARRCWDDGGSVEASLRAFAAETESEVDDELIERALAGVEQLAAISAQVGVRGLVLSQRLSGWFDRVLAFEPDVHEGLESVARYAAQFAALCERVKIRDAEDTPRG